MINEVNVSESMSEEKHIPILLMWVSSENLIRTLIDKKIKDDFSRYVMGIGYTHFLNWVKHGHSIAPLVFHGVLPGQFFKNNQKNAKYRKNNYGLFFLR